jgi:hypothetical protein
MKTLFAVVLATVLFVPVLAHAQALQCSQPVSAGANPVASDCLFILNVAVGNTTCTPECVCAPSGTLPAKATDALLCLNAAVGAEVTLDCPCDVTTTTVSTTTTTVTLPPGDDDNDGLQNADDPCPAEALNRCAGTVVEDIDTGRLVRLNAINPNDVNFPCRGQRIDCNGDVWEADYAYNHQSAAFQCDLPGDTCDTLLGITEVFGCQDENTADIFRCEHFGSPNLSDLAYSFNVPNGTYIVNLLFGNVYRHTVTVGSRLFDVAIESQVVLDDFDQVAAAGASGKLVNRAIIVDVTDGDGLQIEFIRDVQNPAIKGIEVLSMN